MTRVKEPWQTRITAGAAGDCSVKTKYKYKINLNKNDFCCKSNFKPRIGLRQFNGNMAYRGGMIIYSFALLLVSLRCCWSGRVGGAGRADLVVFAQWSHQIWDHIPAKSIAVTDRKIISVNQKIRNTSKIITHKIEKQMHFFSEWQTMRSRIEK